MRRLWQCLEEMERGPLGAAVREREEVLPKESKVLGGWAAIAREQGPAATVFVPVAEPRHLIKGVSHVIT